MVDQEMCFRDVVRMRSFSLQITVNTDISCIYFGELVMQSDKSDCK